jgi:tetratricopeptide (TPR) repeat protein
MDLELDDDLGGQLVGRRYVTLAHEMLRQVAPLVLDMDRADSPDSLALLDDHLPNLRGLFDAALRLPHPPFAPLCDLLKGINRYLNARALYREQVEWAQGLLAYFLDHEDETDESIDLAILNTIAYGRDALGEHAEALDLYEFMIELYADDPDHPGLAVVCFNAALAAHRIGDNACALALCQRSIVIDELHDNARGQAISLMLLADLYAVHDQVNEALVALQRSLALIEPLDNRTLRAQITGKLAQHTARYIDWERAEALFVEAIALWRALGDSEQLASTLFSYAELLHQTGRQDQALQYAEESLHLFQASDLFHAQTVQAAINVWQSNRVE